MFEWIFGNSNKKEIEAVKKEVKCSFSDVKNDIEKIGKWINHLNNKNNSLDSCLKDVREDLSSVKNEIEQLKDVLAMFGDSVSKQVFKTNSRLFKGQTAVEGVQTAVQTAVQTGNFLGISNLSVTERAIIWVLANNELKLSYEDLAAMLGKTTSTIRGQINSIKQKSEGLICESMEGNGKKRVYIPEEIKEKILKKMKVRVRGQKKAKN